MKIPENTFKIPPILQIDDVWCVFVYCQNKNNIEKITLYILNFCKKTKRDSVHKFSFKTINQRQLATENYICSIFRTLEHVWLEASLVVADKCDF